MEILGKILCSPARVKIMRLFLLNKAQAFSTQEVAKRSRVSQALARKELNLLASATFIRRKGDGWVFDPGFKFAREFEDLLLNTDTLEREAITDTFKKAGRIKLLVVSGIFIKNRSSRVDLLLVGNNLRRGKIEEGIRRLEAEIGAELTYAVFETKEFAYRLDMYDKLVRDILDFPHEVLFQAKELSTSVLKKA